MRWVIAGAFVTALTANLLILAEETQFFRAAPVKVAPVPPVRPLRNELERESSSEGRRGIQVAIKSLHRDGHKLSVAYTLTWAEREPGTLVFMRMHTNIRMLFWDVNGREMDCDMVLWCWVSDAFARRKAITFEAEETVDVPAGAAFIALEFHDATRRVGIPDGRLL
jgi:hypothetical protein